MLFWCVIDIPVGLLVFRLGYLCSGLVIWDSVELLVYIVTFSNWSSMSWLPDLLRKEE